jgi:D-alanyl-D-alanine carboxypeptidase
LARCPRGALRRAASFFAIAVFALAIQAGSAAAAWAPIKASIIVDAATGKVLSAQNANVRVYPASLTKLMTLYLLFNALDKGKVTLNTMMPISAHAAAQAPAKIGFRPGQRISVRDAILAIVTKSANDVAVVVAEELGGTEPHFAQEMNREAQRLGMTHTEYRNASGLPNRQQHTTAGDMAILTRAIIHDHRKYYRYFSTRRFDWHGEIIPTHDRVMLDYPGADGLKTGFIDASGFNLVSSAVRGGHRLIGVVFGGTTAARRDDHMMALLDRAFAHYGLAAGAPRADRRDALRMAYLERYSPSRLYPGQHRAALRRDAYRLHHRVHHREARRTRRDQHLDREIAMRERHTHTHIRTAHIRAARRHVPVVGRATGSAWGIQVGAYGRYRPARHAARLAVHKLGHMVRSAGIRVTRRRSGRHFLYEARLLGFTEIQARAACHRLRQRGNECALVAPAA